METGGAIVGAIPSGPLVKSSTHGFSSMGDHSRCRLQDPGCATGTNPYYIAWSYDTHVNIYLNREDSRIILNRGRRGNRRYIPQVHPKRAFHTIYFQ